MRKGELIEQASITDPRCRQSGIHRVQSIGTGRRHPSWHDRNANKPHQQPGQASRDILAKSYVRWLGESGQQSRLSPSASENCYPGRTSYQFLLEASLVHEWYEGPGAALLGTGSRREETRLRSGHTPAQRHVTVLKFTFPVQNVM
ncbi:hypothetical protein TNCV_1423601 [Trichonephila clavipes]|nr:hypothetical protein TNCV_1423601 [Trichonephila clavipes]